MQEMNKQEGAQSSRNQERTNISKEICCLSVLFWVLRLKLSGRILLWCEGEMLQQNEKLLDKSGAMLEESQNISSWKGSTKIRKETA